MISIEGICNKISNTISRELNLDSEKTAVINYGIFAFIQMLMSILIVFLVGFIFNVAIESLIILLTISILRQQSGGIHASSPRICTIIGTILSVGMAVVIKKANIDLEIIYVAGVIIFIWSYYSVYKLVPVDSPSKPIKTEAKRKRLKKSSLLILSVYLIIVLGSILLYYATRKANLLVYSGCIYIGLMWQIFSLTRCGHVVLGKLDALFK
ncbi:MAG: accessory gene regulator B family protein [Clostridium sp.]|nr:accessory gene regulator B family protein [Clostridium sp.]MDU7082265.1 accessory gene regulator B family protein [Clostridium sp.]